MVYVVDVKYLSSITTVCTFMRKIENMIMAKFLKSNLYSTKFVYILFYCILHYNIIFIRAYLL